MALFDNLLQKPEPYRRRVAYISTAILALIIVSVWLLITSQDIKQSIAPSNGQGTRTAEELKKNLPSLQEETVKTQLMKEGQNPMPEKSFDSLTNEGLDSRIIERK